MTEPVAIVHDWLTSMRGGERVVEALYRVFPTADLFTLTWDPAQLSPALVARGATTSAIHRVAHAPFVSGRFRALLPLFPRAVESFKLDKYSLVVSSSHCVAIGALAPPSALHVAYVHSTMRYTREGQHTYEASLPGGRLGKAAFRSTARYLRRWEAEASARPHVLIANSSYTRDRIRRYYQRDAQVIEPPIETHRFERPTGASGVRVGVHGPPSFLVVSALVPNKRVDLAMRAFQGRTERLIVVGEGPERSRLETLVGPNVTLRGRVPEAELARLFASSSALLHPGVDDFGMVMVEALAAGIPVLACAEGGALDIVRDGETGLLIDAPTVDAVRATLDRFHRMPGHFDAERLRDIASRFDRSHFERRFAEAVEDARRHRQTDRRGGSSQRSGTNGVHATNTTNGAHASRGEDGRTGLHATDGLHEVNGLLEVNGHRNGVRTDAVARPKPLPHDSAPSAPAASASRLKRAFDMAAAATGLVLTAPLVVTCAAAIAIESGGPVLFFQRRIGMNQLPFTMVKLRTMDDTGQATRVGRWLRPLGVDEIPQLWNVLAGEMSVIGPRPEVLERVSRYNREIPGYAGRHHVRPGITGLAQVRGLRGDHSGTIPDRLSQDLDYVASWTFATDLRILALTLPRVLKDSYLALRR